MANDIAFWTRKVADAQRDIDEAVARHAEARRRLAEFDPSALTPSDELPADATHLRRPEYLAAWLFDRKSTMPVWLIEKYQSQPLPDEKIGHYATAVDGEFWRWLDPAKFEELYTPVARTSALPAAGEVREALPWDAHSNRYYEPVELRAEKIFGRFDYDGPGKKPDWAPHGNSDKQDEARNIARRLLREAGHIPQAAIALPQSKEAGETITVRYNPCLAKLRPDEPFFVLLGRDKQAPNAVMTWANDRQAAEGKSSWTEQAREVAYEMAAYSGIDPSPASPATQGEEGIAVPSEPTPEMAIAGRKALAVVADRMETAKLLATSSIDFWQQVGHEPANEIYKAMVAAAPAGTM